MIMKTIVHSVALLFVSAMPALSQINNPWTQYNQVPYLQNPALSGIEGYTDIKLGFKKQWSTFKGAPQTYFLGVNHVFNKPDTEVSSDKKPILSGLSGYIAQNRYNFINDTQIGLSYAVHVPVSSKYYISMGLSTSYNWLKASMDELVVRDTQDPFYQNLLQNSGALNYFNMDGGLILYSDRLYAGYAIQRLVRTRLNSDLQGNEKSNLRHTLLLLYNYQLTESVELQPGLLYRYESALKDIYNISLKVRYNASLWGGISYSPKEAISLLAGYRINHLLTLSYSYDISIGGTNSASQGSHELILGFTPFNKVGQKTMFW
jgi:type IX secretion system PorP/SprF family membrane protein